ncbi:RNA polymerase sigma factor [Endozoicomonas ascidiicola]|uniref:RNA polymerase sigma factor n=1 Tax=Endozoicomonas ascidiicola TaxID=1698521 RepID=UPI000834A147|nr:sigma-70 family RNA polymerase sigma factor [Endozoicomonas ascidiicola]
MDRALLNQLYRYAIALTRDSDEAFDLLQQSVERYLRRSNFQSDDHVREPSAYLMRTIRNQFFDQARHQRMHLVVNEQLQQANTELDDTPSPDDLLIHQQMAEGLIKQLDSHEQELLYLWAVEEYTAQEIATMRSQPRGTILSQLHRLKKKLRTQLDTDIRRVLHET